MKKFAFIVMLHFIATLTYADTIVLKNGKKLDVEGTWEKDGKIMCVMYGSVVGIPKEDVLRVIHTEENNDNFTPQNKIEYKSYKKKKYTTQSSSRKTVLSRKGERETIESNCERKWGTNYRMVRYCIEKQTSAKSAVSYSPSNVIKSNCERKWGTDYRMVKYCIEK